MKAADRRCIDCGCKVIRDGARCTRCNSRVRPLKTPAYETIARLNDALRRWPLPLALVFVCLTGCDSIRVALKPPEPPDLKCSPACFVACDPLPKWGDGDRDHEDTVFYVDGLMYGQCSARHDACTACLTDARKAGAIK